MKYISTEIINNIYKKYQNGKPLNRKENSLFYKGDKDLLGSELPFLMTNEEIFIWVDCHRNPVKFIESINWTPNGKLVLRDYQKNWVVETINNRFIIFMNSRQVGYSLISSYLDLWDAMFYGKKVVIYDIKLAFLRESYNKIRDVYSNLPFFLKKPIFSWNKNEISFTNGGSINFSTYKNDSKVYDIYKLHNFAFTSYCSNEKFYKSIIPKLKSDSCIRIDSTPNGYNFYYELVMNSELPENAPNKNMFKTIKTYWWEVPNRDDVWKQNAIYDIGSIDAFNQEYELKFTIR